jgi:hypothetical protein
MLVVNHNESIAIFQEMRYKINPDVAAMGLAIHGMAIVLQHISPSKRAKIRAYS